MKKTGLFIILILALAINAKAQWAFSGSNTWAGNWQAGYIGIGTATPTEKLTIGPGSGAGVIAGAPLLGMFGSGLSGSSDQRFLMYVDTQKHLLFEAPKDASGNKLNIQFNWRNNATPAFFIQGSTSNIGIGTSTPGAGYKLDVAGAINATGVYVNGTLISGDAFWTKTGNNVTTNSIIGVGTTLANNPNGYMFAINGKIGAKEVQIENTSTTWPDYVFKSSYKMMSLPEVESFIKANGHLPEVPSEEQVKAEGIKVYEMNAKLLQKIEELTLHLIEANKRIDTLSEQVKKLKDKGDQ